jgi:hypothetical protein
MTDPRATDQHDGHEKQAGLSEPWPPNASAEQEDRKPELTNPYPPTVRMLLLFAGGVALFALVIAWVRNRHFRD